MHISIQYKTDYAKLRSIYLLYSLDDDVRGKQWHFVLGVRFIYISHQQQSVISFNIASRNRDSERNEEGGRRSGDNRFSVFNPMTKTPFICQTSRHHHFVQRVCTVRVWISLLIVIECRTLADLSSNISVCLPVCEVKEAHWMRLKV